MSRLKQEMITMESLEDQYDAGDAAYEFYKTSEQWYIDHPDAQSKDYQSSSAPAYKGKTEGVL